MSGRIVSLVFDSALPAWLKPYAAAFASFAAEDGTRVFPTKARVAKMVGRSTRQTQTAIVELRKRGVLHQVQPPSRYEAPRYVFEVRALPYAGQQWLFPAVPGPQSGVLLPLVSKTHGRSGLLPRGEVDCSRSVSDPSANTKKEFIRKKGGRTLSQWDLEQLDKQQRAIDEQMAAARRRESA